MQHVVGALHRAFRDREIGEIAFEKINAREMCEVAPMAGNQAVDDANLFTTPEKLFCKVGTDEARATRDEV
jgi:hypothetical protein